MYDCSVLSICAAVMHVIPAVEDACIINAGSGHIDAQSCHLVLQKQAR